jgi:hypothetical protein
MEALCQEANESTLAAAGAGMKSRIIAHTSAWDLARKRRTMMRGPRIFRSVAIALMLATSLFVLFSPAATAQDNPFASDVVLAQRNPPLTESIVTRYIEFTAWFYTTQW